MRPSERIVLGPSIDGGYYLLAMKHPHRRLFEDIDWSTEHVKRQTLERADKLGLETVMLPTWYDVDDAATLQMLVQETFCGTRFSPDAISHIAHHSQAVLLHLMEEGRMSLPEVLVSSTQALISPHRLAQFQC